LISFLSHSTNQSHSFWNVKCQIPFTRRPSATDLEKPSNDDSRNFETTVRTVLVDGMRSYSRVNSSSSLRRTGTSRFYDFLRILFAMQNFNNLSSRQAWRRVSSHQRLCVVSSIIWYIHVHVDSNININISINSWRRIGAYWRAPETVTESNSTS
jgi:hypothetical protein